MILVLVHSFLLLFLVNAVFRKMAPVFPWIIFKYKEIEFGLLSVWKCLHGKAQVALGVKVKPHLWDILKSGETIVWAD